MPEMLARLVWLVNNAGLVLLIAVGVPVGAALLLWILDALDEALKVYF